MPAGPRAFGEIVPLLIGVQSNPERDVRLEILAAEHGYSPSHFHRLFTAAVGETPKAHVERVRLERAAYRLALTQESVLEIAISIGFQNHETFCRAFKRRFGATPSAWRRDSARHQKRWIATRMHKERGASELSEVSFLSLSIGDYEPLQPLLRSFFNRYDAEQVGVSLPSLRTETLTVREVR